MGGFSDKLAGGRSGAVLAQNLASPTLRELLSKVWTVSGLI